jgi:nucleotide-binding universal stress UspA family protein
VETQAAIELATRHYEKLFESLRRQAQERNVNLTTHVLVGHPADQILETAATTGASLIVVGHGGKSAIRGWVSGSTSRRIVTHAKCPVLLVRAR